MNPMKKNNGLLPEHGRLASGLLAMADDAGVGLLVLYPDHTALACNDAAMAFLRVGSHTLLSKAHRESSKLAAAKYACVTAPRPREADAIMLVERRQGCYIRCTLRPLPSLDALELCLCVFSQSPTVPTVAHTEIVHVPKDSDADADTSVVGRLTSSELAILRMIGEGLSTQRMARRLSRSPKTVEWHRASLGRKLGVRTRVELARIAITLGIVQSITVDEGCPPRSRGHAGASTHPAHPSLDGTTHEAALNHKLKGGVRL